MKNKHLAERLHLIYNLISVMLTVVYMAPTLKWWELVGLSVYGFFAAFFLNWHLYRFTFPFFDDFLKTGPVQQLTKQIAWTLVGFFPGLPNLARFLYAGPIGRQLLVLVFTAFLAYGIAKKAIPYVVAKCSEWQEANNEVGSLTPKKTPTFRATPLVEIFAGHGAYGLHPMTQVLQIAF